MRKIITRLGLILALLMLANGVQAQKTKTKKKGKAKTTRTTKAPAKVAAIPIEQLLGKVYEGKVGQTVVDFFGTRNIYGDVKQQVFLWEDNTAVIRQVNGNIEEFTFGTYSYENNTLKINDFAYAASDNGNVIELQKTKQNNELRQGKLTVSEPGDLFELIYKRGKYLNADTEATDKEKQDARTYLHIAAAKNVDGAQEFLREYYSKLADNGDKNALLYLTKASAAAGKFSAAHGYIDRLIDIEPDNFTYQCDKGMLYLNENKQSAAKKLWKKLTKKFPSDIKSSEHEFCKKMK